ncbi:MULTISPECIES: hypothetical protein [Mycolicibacterium]|uniref:hypothetical protein n=1 Tax=Mycolicibacterium TaxID=1866885 RepID=UPI00103C4DBF|nr:MULTISPECIES: hypothetical protein [Mycolicibacterium]
MSASLTISAMRPEDHKSFGFYLVLGTVLSAFFVVMIVLFAVVLRSHSRGQETRQARAMAASSMFWSRWSYDSLWRASFAELSDESVRCEAIIDYLIAQRGEPSQRGRTRSNERYDHLDGQIASYQYMLAAVRNAMNYATAQGCGPQVPPSPQLPSN